MTNELQVKPRVSIQSLVHNEDFVKKANDVLGKGTRQFMSSVLSLYNSDKNLQSCDPIKLYNCCLMAAAIKLPFNQNLGHAYIIAYKGEPQLQIGWKGFVQLAQRSGQFKTINCTDVKEGEILKTDRLSGEISWDWEQDDKKRLNKETVGYVAYFELLNGFRKTLYMTVAELERHAHKYSQTYKRGYGVWKDDFDAMSRKTVIKLILSKYAPLSVDMQKAIEYDQADSEGNYVDNKPAFEVSEAELGTSDEDRVEQKVVEEETAN